MPPGIQRILIPAEDLSARVAELGAEIRADYDGRTPILVGVLKGAVVFLADLMRAIDGPCECDFIAVSSYGASTRSSGIVEMTKDLSVPIEGRDVLIVEDIVDTGRTLTYLLRNLETRQPRTLRVCALLDNMGKLGIPVWCYEWMTDFNWLRTNMATPSRGGSLVTSFDAKDVPADLTSNPPIGEDELWANLEYFLRRVLPVAERAGVKLSMHPDDPPTTPIRGVSRIMRTIPNFHRLLDMLPSAHNTITMCQGNFTLMTDDLPSEIELAIPRINLATRARVVWRNGDVCGVQFIDRTDGLPAELASGLKPKSDALSAAHATEPG